MTKNAGRVPVLFSTFQLKGRGSFFSFLGFFCDLSMPFKPAFVIGASLSQTNKHPHKVKANIYPCHIPSEDTQLFMLNKRNFLYFFPYDVKLRYLESVSFPASLSDILSFSHIMFFFCCRCSRYTTSMHFLRKGDNRYF